MQTAMQGKAKVFLLLAVILGSVALLVLMLRPAGASHTSGGVWAHAANACAIDEADVGEYAVGSASLFHKGTITGAITARCNVENLPVTPGGDTLALQLVYRDHDGSGGASRVIARLWQINNSGASSQLAVVDSNLFPASPSFQSQISNFLSVDFDFNNNAYYVEVTVVRNGAAVPAAAIVRLVGILT